LKNGNSMQFALPDGEGRYPLWTCFKCGSFAHNSNNCNSQEIEENSPVEFAASAAANYVDYEGAGAPGKRKVLSNTLEAELALSNEAATTMAAQQKLLRDQLSSEQNKVAAASKAELHMAADNARMATLMDKMESQLDLLEHASRAAEK
jgi:hypothetical protein